MLPCCFVDRTLVEKRVEELQQQVSSLRTEEATLSRTNSELSHRSQQLETRLEVLESELSASREQVRLFLFDTIAILGFSLLTSGLHCGVTDEGELMRQT